MSYFKSISFTIFSCFFAFQFANAQQFSQKIAVLKYSGGGDWYANLETSIPNLIKFCNTELATNIDPEQAVVEASNPEIFNYPFVHMTGHGNVKFTEQEIQNLRKYLSSGGFLHIDDNYGLDQFVRIELKRIFPELELLDLPTNHALYNQKFKFPQGLPKIHEHDNKPPQGLALIKDGRVIVYYTYECDLGDGWEDASVHGNPQESRLKALKMGANLIQYVFMKEGDL